MAYSDWRDVFAAAVTGDPRSEAQLWNVENESRIGRVLGPFKQHLGHLHRKLIAEIEPRKAAQGAVAKAIKETKPVDSKWLGKLPSSGKGAPSTVVTYRSSDTVARYDSDAPIDPSYPPKEPKLDRVNSVDLDGERVPFRRFIWTTWAPGPDDLADEPTAVKQELGLDHFGEGDYVYRCQLPIDSAGQSLFVPTCLDAGLNAAWKPPPAGFTEPWGLSRDLTTGESQWPELLVETRDYLSARPTAELVGESRTPIGQVTVDYMAGRE